jgi:hypothetical protein
MQGLRFKPRPPPKKNITGYFNQQLTQKKPKKFMYFYFIFRSNKHIFIFPKKTHFYLIHLVSNIRRALLYNTRELTHEITRQVQQHAIYFSNGFLASLLMFLYKIYIKKTMLPKKEHVWSTVLHDIGEARQQQ